jgi:multiple sugar transport system substrate-binding protein
MMKKNRIILIAIILLALIVISTTMILIKKSDLMKGTETTNNPVAGEESDVKIITFAVPNICKVDDDNLQQFNDELIKDGHKYRLEIEYLEYDEYAQLLKGELISGDIDVAFLGLGDASGSNEIYDLINSGLVFNLDEILSQERGEVLYNAFPKNLWESVKCNKHIYSIPSVLVNDQGVYAAFNRDYIKDEDIEKWDGSIDGIYEMIKNVEWNNSDAPRFQYLINDYSFEDMIECEIKYGLIFDYESLSIENPLESEKFIHYLNVLNQMKEDGYLTEDISYIDNPGLNSAEVLANVEAGNYMVALSAGSVDEAFLKDNITVKKVTPYLSSRINGSIGISNNTEDIDAVVDFLGLLYDDGKYGNILLYGQEGTDYKVVDGIACNIDGSDLEDDYITKLCFNLYVNIYPVSGEDYMSNRKNEIFSFYDNINLSPFIGFEPDTTELNNISNDVNKFMSSLEDNTVDEASLSTRDKLSSDGIDKYLNSVKSQWEEYLR